MKKIAKNKETAFTAYHINSVDRTITEIRIDKNNSLEELQHAVGGYIETAIEFKNMDTLFVDGEGLLKSPTSFFRVNGFNFQPFAGNGVLIGSTHYGNSKNASTKLEDLKNIITFMSLNEVRKI